MQCGVITTRGYGCLCSFPCRWHTEECSICFGPIVETHQCTYCKYKCCQGCFNKWSIYSNSCPQCRRSRGIRVIVNHSYDVWVEVGQGSWEAVLSCVSCRNSVLVFFDNEIYEYMEGDYAYIMPLH